MLFTLLPQSFSISKLPPDAFSKATADSSIPTILDMTQDFLFIAKTDEEISLVCETGRAPRTALRTKPGWRALRISGELDFSLVGIFATITGLLAEEQISTFAISTFTTDYILVQEENLQKTITTLCNNDHSVEEL